MSAQCNETLKPMTHSTVAGWPDSGGGGGVDQQQTLMDRSMTDESAVVRSPTYNEEDVSRFTELPLTPGKLGFCPSCFVVAVLCALVVIASYILLP